MFAKICMRKTKITRVAGKTVFSEVYFINLSSTAQLIPLLLGEFIPGTNIIRGVRAV